ncbi:DegT/DnrJ/EryC1/StrS family aminotransferase [Streptomyces coeruleorubidus]|uniref:DegT/DnrJ/EryC1/StrS family aminotransferase n=1 Tax=Streptomyces coeruleorubidus TaxID=116188 RepID=UPI0037A3ECD8
MINLFQPQVGQEELAAVADVFATGRLGRAERSAEFESAFADHLGVGPEEIVFLNSGTAALFLTMQLLNLSAGDEVVLPSISFVAAANTIACHGARPVFCDVDPYTLNPSWEDIEPALTPRTKAVLVLHYGGAPGDIERIANRCARRGVVLVEDTVCSPASRVSGRACGTFGDLALWSFDAVKAFTSTDGGMLRVGDPQLARRARRLAYHGLERPEALDHPGAPDPWAGYALGEGARRLVGEDLAAAIGLAQLRKLTGFVHRRREIAALYDELLGDVPGVRTPPALPSGHESSHYFYWVGMDAAIRPAVANELFDAGIYTNFHYAPLHRVPLYGYDGPLPNAERAGEETLCLPMHASLSHDDVRHVAGRLVAAVEGRMGTNPRS